MGWDEVGLDDGGKVKTTCSVGSCVGERLGENEGDPVG